MNQPKAWVADIIIRFVAKMPCESIDKGSAVIAVTGVHHETGGFVDHQHGVVFINYVKRNILRDYLELVSRTIHDNRYNIERLHTVIALYRFSVYEYTSGFGSLLYPVA